VLFFDALPVSCRDRVDSTAWHAAARSNALVGRVAIRQNPDEIPYSLGTHHG
jgi:hypothetical protein